MEEFVKNNNRLINCYRGSANAEDAAEKCKQYADEMSKFVNEGGLEFPTIMKGMWKGFFKTQNYYNLSRPAFGVNH